MLYNLKIFSYSFPKDGKLLELWCSKLGIKQEEIKKSSKLCSDHFEPKHFRSYIGRVELLEQACPMNFKSKAVQW